MPRSLRFEPGPTTDQGTRPARSNRAKVTEPTLPDEQRALADQVRGLGTWFHNVRLDADRRVQTAPDHPLGDFPSNFWQFFQHVVPPDLSGKTVLDIGCNGGFYAMEMARRGARRVLAIDHDQTYLEQARFARDHLGYQDRIELRQVDVYEVGKLGEQFDLVLFLGVLYHLRHPLYALEQVARASGGGRKTAVPDDGARVLGSCGFRGRLPHH